MGNKLVILEPPTGLKCDRAGCGYHDPLPTREEYPGLIGLPCPKCGSSLLTQADMNALVKVEKRVAFVNRWFGWIAFGASLPKTSVGRVDFNGTGKATLTRIT